MTLLLFVACEVQREGRGTSIPAEEHVQIEGYDVGGIIISELQLGGYRVAVDIFGHSVEVACMGGTVVGVGVIDACDLPSSVIVLDGLRKGEVCVGAIEREAEVEGAIAPVFLPGESQGRGSLALPSMGSHGVGHD